MAKILEEIFSHQKQRVKEEKVLLKAHQKSKRIIERAVKRANRILTQTNFFHKSLKEMLKQELKKSVTTAAAVYQKELKELINQSLEENHAFLHHQVEAMRQMVEKELAAYEEERKRVIDQDIRQQAAEFVQEAFVEELPPSFKEQLVLKALEKAKKNGFFTNH